METAQYYDKVADSYQEKFTTGYLGKLRKKERKVVYEFLDPQPNEYILDAGCGTGFDAIPLMEKGSKVFGIDISEGMVKVAISRGVDASVANLEDFELNRTFDKITSQGVLEFCRNHEAIFKNFNKHLKTDGIAVIHFPYKGIMGFIYQIYHRILNSIKIKLFTYRKIKQLAENSGFTVLDFKKAHSFIAVIKLKKANNV